MTPLAATLPESSNDGYVAAAYIVFFALVLVYVVIMAIRLARVERKVQELRGDTAEELRGDTETGLRGDRETGGLARAREGSINGAPDDRHPEGARRPEGAEQERETV